jgi:hypothetical protein
LPRQELGDVDLSQREVRERELGQGSGVARLEPRELPRSLERRRRVTRFAQRDDQQTARKEVSTSAASLARSWRRSTSPSAHTTSSALGAMR